MQVSVIIPCFNEKNTITKIIEKVENASVFLKEIIIVDDFSTDGTREILEKVNNPISEKDLNDLLGVKKYPKLFLEVLLPVLVLPNIQI